MNWKGSVAAAILGMVFVTGCENGAMELPLEPSLATTTGATLVECPVGETRAVSGTIGLLGGTLELDGHSITLPYGAVLMPTPITMTVPAGNYVEVDIHAAGEESFQFQEPVTIAISYERCTRSNIDKESLTVWHIDEETKELLEHMGGEDDKVARRVTFTSGHLSGFVIAN